MTMTITAIQKAKALRLNESEFVGRYSGRIEIRS